MTENIRLIIAGSRNFNDYELLKKEVDEYLFGEVVCNHYSDLTEEIAVIEIVSGGARGTDKLGEKYATENSFKVKKFIPDWERGKSAGIMRNIEMLKYSSHAIVFWDGESRGSKHTIENAKKYNVKLRVIGYVKGLLDE